MKKIMARVKEKLPPIVNLRRIVYSSHATAGKLKQPISRGLLCRAALADDVTKKEEEKGEV